MISGYAAPARSVGVCTSEVASIGPQIAVALRVHRSNAAWRSQGSLVNASSRHLKMHAISCESIAYSSGSREFVGYKATPEGPGKRVCDS